MLSHTEDTLTRRTGSYISHPFPLLPAILRGSLYGPHSAAWDCVEAASASNDSPFCKGEMDLPPAHTGSTRFRRLELVLASVPAK
jgi:hypothetical protein